MDEFFFVLGGIANVVLAYRVVCLYRLYKRTQGWRPRHIVALLFLAWLFYVIPAGIAEAMVGRYETVHWFSANEINHVNPPVFFGLSILFLLIWLALESGLQTQIRRGQEERQRQDEEKHKKAIVDIRQRSDLFLIKRDFGQEAIETAVRKRDPVKWIEALGKKADHFKATVTDASLVVGDDVEELIALRNRLETEVVRPSDDVMLTLRDDVVRTPLVQKAALLKVTDRFVIPDHLKTRELNKRLGRISQPIGMQVGRILQHQHRQSQDFVFLALTLAVGWMRYKSEQSRLRVEAEKLQGEVEAYAVEVEGTLKVLQELQRFIADLRQGHEEHEQKTRDLLTQVEAFMNVRKQDGQPCDNFFSFSPLEQTILESLYIEGEQLKSLMGVQILPLSTEA